MCGTCVREGEKGIFSVREIVHMLDRNIGRVQKLSQRKIRNTTYYLLQIAASNVFNLKNLFLNPAANIAV